MKELADTRAEIRNVQEAKSHFLANITQEIRTPLNSIIGFSQILLRDLATKPEEQDTDHHYLIRKIENAANTSLKSSIVSWICHRLKSER